MLAGTCGVREARLLDLDLAIRVYRGEYRLGTDGRLPDGKVRNAICRSQLYHIEEVPSLAPLMSLECS